MDIPSILEQQRKSLLDLTYRNRLLNMPRKPTARSLVIHDELSHEVLRILLAGKAMSFVPMDERRARAEGIEEEVAPDELEAEADSPALPQPSPDEPGTDESEAGPAARHVDSRLQTFLGSDHLQRRLLEIHYEARTLLEEQGVNVLYLACGQLRMLDRGESGEPRHAPLVLLPVSLERRSARERFVLKWTEEDPQENLSLREKLKSDFRIELPPFPEPDAFDVQAYFKAVAEAVSSQPGWSVQPDAMLLGFFSFSKLLMFLDLDPAKWPESSPLAEKETLQGLLGAGFEQAGDPFGGCGERLDALLPVEAMRHIVDCDSSQALAIESVRRGGHLVIQGPPGTGKSQTIANLIAAAVADGRKVLFVAEKMAALEVVKRRLENVGLGALCLELHSNKANKRAVLEELGRTLALGAPAAHDVQDNVQRLSTLRDRLNRHVDRMHRSLGASMLTPYRVIGELARRQGQDNPPGYRLDGAEAWTPRDLEQKREALQRVLERLPAVGLPGESPWRGLRHPPLMRPQAEQLLAPLEGLLDAFTHFARDAEALARQIGAPAPETLGEAQQQATLAEHLAEAPDYDRATIASGVWMAGLESLRESVRQGRLLAGIEARRRESVSELGWDMDWLPVRQVLAVRGQSWLRWLDGHWRDATRQLGSVLTGPLPRTAAERLALVDDLIAARKARETLQAGDATARAAFGRVWQGTATRWELAEAILGWVERHPSADGDRLRTLAAGVDDRTGLRPAIERAQASRMQWSQALSAFAERVGWLCQPAFGVAGWEQVPLAELRQRLQAWRGNVDGLMHWLAYLDACRQARELGLEAVLAELRGSSGQWPRALPRFELAYYQRLLDVATASDPELAGFDGREHDKLVQQFREWDRRRLLSSQYEVAMVHHRQAPRQTGAAIGALGTLRSEIQRKARHMPIRKLMRLCAGPIQALKPVFMMSPLSVAQFLEPGAVEFDLLVIDEASQVEPVDALGAIARCRQVVVVGDDKQLPPTSFFARVVGGDELDESEEGAGAKDLESILSLCVAKGLPQRMLQWHYRSRHESLIAVSNREFYDSRLFIVPSPDHARAETGLVLRHFPEGRFDRGASQKNLVEARAIAEAVLQHARERPELTLGVGAMSVRQRQAVTDELELLRREHPELEDFLQRHPHEPFFVKNLENIQGDERDVIYITIGYGRSRSDDRLYANFGPLNADGGHRRLNVLITRARLRCEVFSSLLAGDIKVDAASKRGVAALKTFLEYAENGRLGVPTFTGRGPDSPFEEAVHTALSAAGHEVHNQVGVAGFFIDLAVVDPDNPGRYLLGIECDGASYHSAPAARDRDRLRQEILEGHGWTLHRIWSTDWFQRRDAELQRLLDAVEAARRKAAKRAKAPAATSSSANPRPAPSPGVRRTEAPATGTPQDPGPGAAAYQLAAFIPEDHTLQPHEVPLASMARTLRRVLEQEAPIHMDHLVARVRDLWGLGRAGSRIQAAVQDALTSLSRTEPDLMEEDGCYWLRDQPVQPRDRSSVDTSPSLKKPDLLPPVEIRAAALAIAREAHGASRDELVTTVARSLGILSTSSALRERILGQLQQLELQGELQERGGLLVAVEQD